MCVECAPRHWSLGCAFISHRTPNRHGRRPTTRPRSRSDRMGGRLLRRHARIARQSAVVPIAVHVCVCACVALMSVHWRQQRVVWAGRSAVRAL